MGTPEIVSLSVSLFSLLVAGLAAYYSYALGARQLHLASRHEFKKLLLELDKELMRDPSLWGLDISHPMAKIDADSPVQRAKLEAFAFYKLNLFNMVFVYASESRSSSSADSELFEGLDRYCRDCLATEPILAGIVKDEKFERLFGKAFTQHIRKMLPPEVPAPA